MPQFISPGKFLIFQHLPLSNLLQIRLLLFIILFSEYVFEVRLARDHRGLGLSVTGGLDSQVNTDIQAKDLKWEKVKREFRIIEE